MTHEILINGKSLEQLEAEMADLEAQFRTLVNAPPDEPPPVGALTDFVATLLPRMRVLAGEQKEFQHRQAALTRLIEQRQQGQRARRQLVEVNALQAQHDALGKTLTQFQQRLAALSNPSTTAARLATEQGIPQAVVNEIIAQYRD